MIVYDRAYMLNEFTDCCVVEVINVFPFNALHEERVHWVKHTYYPPGPLEEVQLIIMFVLQHFLMDCDAISILMKNVQA